MEVFGSLLLGYAQACINLKIVADEQASSLVEGIKYLNWYPLEKWQKLGDIDYIEVNNNKNKDIFKIIFYKAA